MYKVTVTPDVGSAISDLDSVTAKFLTPPVVTYPTEGLTNVPQSPTSRWGAVSGATHYRIKMFNNNSKEPVYFTPYNKYTDFTSYKIPPGDLAPNTNYSVTIEAYSASQDLDMRAVTGWINFKTGAW